ncbi:MAG: choline-sulfatase, partial [Planctomycetota bacterium]
MAAVRLTVLASIAIANGCGPAQQRALSGVIITIDTTNPSALDIYGADRGVTPFLSELARSSIVYERAHTVAPITLPAHTSMMTGLYPLRHGVRDNGWARLSADAETLAERARAAGLRTAAFVSAVVLSAPYGLDQGFELYSEPEHAPGGSLASVTQRGSRAVTDDALSWLERTDPEQPFVMWVHYFDPHWPYEAPESFLKQAGGHAYLAEVAVMDNDIGRLVRALDERIGADAYMLAVVADHGESFGRHGEPTHSAFTYQATVQVPFLLRFPDGRRAGTRSDELVSVVDLFPTYTDVLALGAPGQVDGISLAGERVGEDRGLYVESYSGFLNYGWSPLSGWVNADGKYLHSSRPEYYDLAQDPKEEHDLMAQREVDVAPYLDALERLSALPRLESSELELDEAGLAQLRALGYAAAGGEVRALPDPLAPSDRPAPRDQAEHHAQFSTALGLAQAGETAQAVSLLQEVLANNPGNLFAVETLAGCLLEEDHFAQVLELLEPLAGQVADRHQCQVYLAATY